MEAVRDGTPPKVWRRLISPRHRTKRQMKEYPRPSAFFYDLAFNDSQFATSETQRMRFSDSEGLKNRITCGRRLHSALRDFREQVHREKSPVPLLVLVNYRCTEAVQVGKKEAPQALLIDPA